VIFWHGAPTNVVPFRELEPPLTQSRLPPTPPSKSDCLTAFAYRLLSCQHLSSTRIPTHLSPHHIISSPFISRHLSSTHPSLHLSHLIFSYATYHLLPCVPHSYTLSPPPMLIVSTSPSHRIPPSTSTSSSYATSSPSHYTSTLVCRHPCTPSHHSTIHIIHLAIAPSLFCVGLVQAPLQLPSPSSTSAC
jgi:hypothetical protein